MVKPKLPLALRQELSIDGRKPKRKAEHSQETRRKVRLYRPADASSDGEKGGRKTIKSILKATKVQKPKTREDFLMEQDDKEIDYWEAKLGQKQSKVEDDEDGLDDLFEGLSLPRGPSALVQTTDDEEEQHEVSEDEASESEKEEDDDDEEEQEQEFTGFDDHQDRETTPKNKIVKPSIYLPYSEESTAPEPAMAKQMYVPPALRAAQSETTLLTRQLKGLLNRLSSTNIATIISELEAMYRVKARGIMNEELSRLLLDIVSNKAGLLDTFVILHAAVVAALYKCTGIEFAASFVQTLVETVSRGINASESGETLATMRDPREGRKAINLISLLTELYNLNVVAAPLLYDFIRLLIDNLDESNVEILLVIVKSSGSQLRADDPSSLRDILTLLQSALSTQYPTKDYPIRMKFMLDQMMNLKNNKTTLHEGQQGKDLRIRMKKFIGSLHTSSGAGASGEPLRVTLDDIRNVDTRGKWWLVGASWKNASQSAMRMEEEHEEGSDGFKGDLDDGLQSQDLLKLAKEHRINNPVRKQIFVTLLSSADYQEAISSLLTLRLKKSQEPEIARVLILLVAGEERYNAYYTHVAKGISERHGMRISLQFCLWDFLRECGEEDIGQLGASGFDDEQSSRHVMGSPKVSTRRIINIAKFYGDLVAYGTLSLTILKTLTFAKLKFQTKTFLNLFMTQIFLSLAKMYEKQADQEKKIVELFGKLRKTEDGSTFIREGVDWFLRKTVSKCTVCTSATERSIVQQGVQTARAIMSL